MKEDLLKKIEHQLDMGVNTIAKDDWWQGYIIGRTAILDPRSGSRSTSRHLSLGAYRKGH